jgi:hypothetical protein
MCSLSAAGAPPCGKSSPSAARVRQEADGVDDNPLHFGFVRLLLAGADHPVGQTPRHKRMVAALDQHGLLTRRGRKLIEPLNHFAGRDKHSLDDGRYSIS